MKGPTLQTGLTDPPKRGRGRPRKPMPLVSNNNISLDNMYMDGSKSIELAGNNQELSSAKDFKSLLTLKELKFLEIYLLGDMNLDQAMISAGYEGYHQKSLYRLGRKIVEKYESRAGDHRKIFRAIGAGEVAVARGLLSIAQDEKNPADVRRKAWADLASCMGLKGEVIESYQGISIIIKGEDDEPGAGQGLQTVKALPPPVKPRQVVK